jgi:RNA polymerase sigma-70 factor (ECF subfamily)
VASSVNDDQLLVERVQQGDKRAFDLLVKKYQHKVISLVMRFVHNQSEAEDVAQEAFLKAYRALANFRGDSAFYTWLYRIAANTAKNHLAQKQRRHSDKHVDVDDMVLTEGDSVLTAIENPENHLAGEQLQLAIHQVLEKLPDDLKTALMLREFEGLSYDEIAEVMDCPVGTVRSRIFRAREAIDKIVKPLMSGELEEMV